MPTKLIAWTAGAFCLLGPALDGSHAAMASYDRSGLHTRGVGVNVAPQIAYGGPRVKLDGNCPYCYKGYDYGSDCYQYVWNGFQQLWVNVCLWGWR